MKGFRIDISRKIRIGKEIENQVPKEKEEKWYVKVVMKNLEQ